MGYGAFAVSGKHSVTLGTVAPNQRFRTDFIAENPNNIVLRRRSTVGSDRKGSALPFNPGTDTEVLVR